MKTGLQWASSNVLSNQIPALLQVADQYPAVAMMLDENADLISEAFDTIPVSTFDNYDDG